MKIDELNNFDLRSDFENDIITLNGKNIFKFEGYVGNRPSENEDEFHEDDTWAIDFHWSGGEVTSYLYSSEYEYNQDVKILTEK